MRGARYITRRGVFARLLILWLGMMLLARVAFMLYQRAHSLRLSWSEQLGALWHALPMDLSLLAYLSLPVLLILGFTGRASERFARLAVLFLNGLLGTLFLLVSVVDCVLYSYWHFRIDYTVLEYLKSPKEALASSPWWQIALGVLLIVLLVLLFWRISARWVWPRRAKMLSWRWWFVPLGVLCAATMIIPIRGGVGVATMNAASVYFSRNMLANHTALNPLWNLLYSIEKRRGATDRYPDLISNAEVVTRNHRLERRDTVLSPALLRTARPNVIMIIMESQSAGFSKLLGSEIDAMPNFDALAKEGVLFTRVYASGTRSDKGIVSLLSGYPAQPKKSVIRYPQKFQKLASLPATFDSLGYSTAFFHGGDTRFYNFRAYFYSAGIERVEDLQTIQLNAPRNRWGYADEYLFDLLFRDVDSAKAPFFRALFTLSNHEPFTVPGRIPAKGAESEKVFLTARYADSCLGEFIARAKKRPWWDSTLFVITADHAHYYPSRALLNSAERYHIPLLLVGGALSDSVAGQIPHLMGQQDIAATLLGQMGLPASRFRFSRDVFTAAKRFALSVHDVGFVWITPEGSLAFDLPSQQEAGEREGSLPDGELLDAWARFQIQQTHFLGL